MLTSFFKPAEGKGKKSARPDDASTSDDVDEGSAKKLRTDDSATAANSVAATAAVTPGSLGRSPQSQALFEELTDPEWRAALQRECGKPYVAKMAEQVAAEQAKQTVFPPRGQIFTAFNAVPLSKVRVVIIGQDPYHGPGQAHGLCFSVLRGVVTPPSLKNIYKELQTDVEGFEPPSHGNLQSWADQGIFMLNATMTVRKANANSHQKFGWQEFTDAVIKLINEETRGVVFILWGGFAQKKGKVINRNRHCVIEAAHPSPLSVTKFRGCKVFSKTNAYLLTKGQPPVDWSVPE